MRKNARGAPCPQRGPGGAEPGFHLQMCPRGCRGSGGGGSTSAARVPLSHVIVWSAVSNQRGQVRRQSQQSLWRCDVPIRVTIGILLLFSSQVMSESLRPHGLQQARPPCPSPSPRVYSNSRPSSRRCHPAASSSVVPCSSCLQFFPAPGHHISEF